MWVNNLIHSFNRNYWLSYIKPLCRGWMNKSRHCAPPYRIYSLGKRHNVSKWAYKKYKVTVIIRSMKENYTERCMERAWVQKGHSWNSITWDKGRLPRCLSGKNPLANAGDRGLIPGVEKIPWRRKWQLTPVFLPGESHGERTPTGYSPRVAKSWTQLSNLALHAQASIWRMNRI